MMTKESQMIFTSLTDISDQYIDEARPAPREARRLMTRKMLALVAVLVLLICSFTVFASHLWGTQVIEFFTGRIEEGSDYKESGYDLSVAIEKKSFDLLKGEIQGVPDHIVEAFKTTDIYSSWYPGNWQEEFSNTSQAIDFIGYPGLEKTLWSLKEEGVVLDVLGGKDGRVSRVRLETKYKSGDVRLSSVATIYTSDFEGPISLGVTSTEDLTFEEKTFTTVRDEGCHVIYTSPMDSGYLALEGYLVKGGVLYTLHVTYQAKDASLADDLLHQWADLF